MARCEAGRALTLRAQDQPRLSLQAEPHRLLFPLGIILAGTGVLPWLFFVLGLTEAYRPIFHSVVFRSMFHPLAEIEGFLSCFAVGFLFTVLPRRTATAPPAPWQMALAVAAPVAIVTSAAVQKWVVGQIAWLLLIGMAVEFSLRRLRSQDIPLLAGPGTIWIWLALFMGAAGAILATAGELVQDWFWLHEVGRSFLTQGLFTALALGTANLRFVRAHETKVGSDANSGALGSRPRFAATATSFVAGGKGLKAAAHRAGWAYAANALGSGLFLASFWIGQLVFQPLGFALRAAVTLTAVLRLVRAPPLADAPGALGRAARIALWMLPVGSAWVALVPESRRAGLHVIYLGCFAMLILVISTHLSPWRPGGTDELPSVDSRRLGLGWACLAIALGARILVEMDPPNFKLWLGIACASFVAATLFSLPDLLNRLVEPIKATSGKRA